MKVFVTHKSNAFNGVSVYIKRKSCFLLFIISSGTNSSVYLFPCCGKHATEIWLNAQASINETGHLYLSCSRKTIKTHTLHCAL
jgi:hypothetical protein